MNFPPLPSSLEAALAERGYASATPVQAEVLQPEAAGRDLIVSAQTGSGKTIAFGLAMAKELLGASDTIAFAVRPLALIIAPPFIAEKKHIDEIVDKLRRVLASL